MLAGPCSLLAASRYINQGCEFVINVYFVGVKDGEKIPVAAPTDDGVERSLPKRGNTCPINRVFKLSRY